MKTPKPFLVLLLLLQTILLTAQVQWYQNQDGNNPPPGGTNAVSVQSFTDNSFIACYLWSINNDEYTWKISRTSINGVEDRSFFVTGTSANIEVKIGKNNSVYVLKCSYPAGQNAEYIIYKLDGDLNVREQRSISFPNNFIILTLNAFELDNTGNVYVAGDGQYPDGANFNPASFVLKTDKNLHIKWSRVDSVQTSFTRLHIDRNGTVLVVEDYYSFYPDIRLKKISSHGQYSHTITIHTDPARYSLFSVLDKSDNLLIYGGKSSVQGSAMYICKVSRNTGRKVYHKTHFSAAGSQLNDLKLDKHGNIFSLVTLYQQDGTQESRISRIKPSNGKISWNRSLQYELDSCILAKLVINEDNLFYAVGEKRSHTYFSKGFAMGMRKNGQREGNFPAPDSVDFLRSHWLAAGIIDRTNKLIAIGNTSDFDTTTYSSSYYRSFAVKFGSNNDYGCDENGIPVAEVIAMASAITKTEEPALNPKLVLYPNPVQNQLEVSNINPEEYDRMVIYSMQGAMVLQQAITTRTLRVDVTALKDGVYLFVLRSSITLKEKSIKFVVNK